MKFTREQSEGLYTIHAFRDEEVTLNSPFDEAGRDEDGRLTLVSSFVVSPRRLIREWPLDNLSQLTGAHLATVGEMKPEVILLGTGRRMQFPASEQLAELIAMGIGYEVMDSAAACRTYNILAGEGRQVAAAIIIE